MLRSFFFPKSKSKSKSKDFGNVSELKSCVKPSVTLCKDLIEIAVQ